MSPIILQESNQISELFKAFHSHNLPKKRKLCDELRYLIDDGEIRGSEQIGTLLCKLISEEIDNEALEEAICKVLDMEEKNLDDFRKDPDYDPNSTDNDDNVDDDEQEDDKHDGMEDDIQLAQRVPEMNGDFPPYPPPPPPRRIINVIEDHNNVLSENDKNEVSLLCKLMMDQLKKMEEACRNQLAHRAIEEVDKMYAYCANLEVIKCILKNHH